MKLSEHFDSKEFDCKCGRCKVMGDQMRERTITLLEKARQRAGIPFVITSGMRCEEYNEEVGGVDSSAHLQGYAADIYCRDTVSRFKIMSALLEAGFTRMGMGNTFIHVDNDPSKPHNRIWPY